MKTAFSLEQQTLLEQEYPRFSDAEITRRRRNVTDRLAAKSVDKLAARGIGGIGGRGGAVNWLSQWLVTNESQLAFPPAARDSLFIQCFNHVSLVTRLADNAVIHWGDS